jgi:two-component system chemotaxis response regulator CheB
VIRTLLVDDSPAFLAVLREVLAEDAEFEIVGEARDGVRALSLAISLRPALVLMDVQMPGADGIATTAHIMRDAPCPVVVMSGTVGADRQRTVFEALGAGAVEALPKPRDLASAPARARLRQQLKAMSQVKVVRRRLTGAFPVLGVEPVRVVAVGSSTGGPPALCSLLAQLPRDFAPSVLLAQHLAAGFGEGLCQWLQSTCALPVVRLRGARPREPGTVYLAADGHHLLAEGGEVRAVPAAPGDLSVPGVDRLFASLEPMARAVVAAVLTGMGSDGAVGLERLRQAGAYTLVQDEATSLIYGMPRAARDRGGAIDELPLPALARRIVEVSGRGRGAGVVP